MLLLTNKYVKDTSGYWHERSRNVLILIDICDHCADVNLEKSYIYMFNIISKSYIYIKPHGTGTVLKKWIQYSTE